MPTENEKISQTINLLILYQGEAAKNFADCPQLSFSEDLPGNVKCQVRQVGYNRNNSEESIFDLFLKEVAWADAMLAIIAEDDRPASMAGNVWLEIGWWCARKPPATYLLCIQESKQVCTISDFPSKVTPRFSNNDKLYSLAYDFVMGMKSFKYDCHDPITNTILVSDKRKLEETIGCDKWPSGGAHICEYLSSPNPPTQDDQDHLEESNCEFRIQSTHLIGELMRMSRSNQETAEIQSLFYQFYRYAEAILATDETNYKHSDLDGAESHRDTERKSLFNKAVKCLSKLEQLVKELLLPRSEYYNEPITDPWDKLKAFIIYRIDVAIDNHSELTGLDLALIELRTTKRHVEQFIPWAKLLTTEGCDENPYYLERRRATPNSPSTIEANKVNDFFRMSKNLAVLFEYYGYHFFRNCRNSIKNCLASENPFHNLSISFSKTRTNLPHNVDSNHLPNIWARKGDRRA